MLIAKKIKKENIVEYLLYMWQIEDIIRACNFNIDTINKQIISTLNLSTEDEKSTYEWYENLIGMMKIENVQEKGHIQINQNIIIDLNDLHSKLLQSSKNAAYSAKFYHILPFINQLRQQQTNESISDIEICFNFLYGILLLRIKKVEISKETTQAQEEISKFMALLAQNHNLYKEGKLELE